MSWNPAARGDTFWWIAGIGLVLVTSLSLSWCYWKELRGDQESLSTTVRNVGVVIGGVIAILFAIWRSIVAERQADAAQRQAETAQRQSETAQRGLLNERYQKGAEMFGSGRLSVRLGGVYALALLAREHPGDYHLEIMSLFCAFVRNPIGEPFEAPLPVKSLTPAAKFKSGWEEAGDEAGEDRPLRVREDIQAIMTAVCKRSEAQIEIEKEREYTLALRDANLKGARLAGANLEGADLTGADLRDCRGLTQEQLDQATADSDKPPKLVDVVDANGEPLVWSGKEPAS